MTTSVCQGIQSQFDPWLGEPRIMGFKLSQPSPKISLSPICFPRSPISDNSHTGQQQTTHKNDFNLCSELINEKRTSPKNEDFGGLSFLQAITNTTQNSENEKNKEVYVHPLVKKSASMLSLKSLEMCTESLGSETGSTISESEDELISSSFVSDAVKSSRMSCFTIVKGRSMSSGSFPPPITTISGGFSGGFHVESQRENGRLVIKAVSVSRNTSYFVGERSNGCLKLRLLDNSDFVQEDEVYDDDDNGGLVSDVHDIEGSSGNNVGDRRNSRCNEEGASMRCKELVNWEPHLVATS